MPSERAHVNLVNLAGRALRHPPATITKEALGQSALCTAWWEMGGLWLFDMHLLRNKWTTSSIYKLLMTLVRVRWSLRANLKHNNLSRDCHWIRWERPFLVMGNTDGILSAFVCLFACLLACLFPTSLRYNRHRLCKFKVFNMLILYTSMLQNLPQSSSSTTNRGDNYILVWIVLAFSPQALIKSSEKHTGERRAEILALLVTAVLGVSPAGGSQLPQLWQTPNP